MSRKGTPLLLGAVVFGWAAGAAASGWLRLGQQYVDYRARSVAVEVKPDAPPLTQLKLQVRDNPLEIDSVKVYLDGGQSFEVTLNAWVAAGGETRAIEIPRSPQAVKRVEVFCRNGSAEDKLALLRLLGVS